MRPKNEALHAAVAKVVELKLQINTAKELAEKHHSTPSTVRSLICRAMKEAKINTRVDSRGTADVNSSSTSS